MMGKKVAVGLSGGVDSAVSALLLKRAGYDVVGVHLYCWPPKSEVQRDGVTREEWIKRNGCRADEDRASALKTALEIGIPFKELDFSEEYNSRVIKYFYEEYEAGRTPNPDVLCNSEIKFGMFLDWALENGFDYIATGHYASLRHCELRSTEAVPANWDIFHSSEIASVRSTETRNDEVKLFIPKDKHKDQTYFLWKLTENELKHVLFPLGDLLKSEVREIAREAGLSVTDKKDSQGICFVGNVEVREFLKRRLVEKPGEVVDIAGNVIGKHKGVAFYTIGERGGWELDSNAQREMMAGGETKQLFVTDKVAGTNKLIVGEKNEVMSKKIIVEGVSLINRMKGEEVEKNLKGVMEKEGFFVRIRHGGEMVKVEKIEVICIDSGSRSGMTEIDCHGSSTETSPVGRQDSKNQSKELTFELEREVFGVASGQSAVLYTGAGVCLGGGVIE